ncbi:MAG: serine protease [Rhodospirillaceae bacterium]
MTGPNTSARGGAPSALLIALWGVVVVLAALAGARLAGRLPHVLPVLALPLDDEGRLELVVAARRAQLADCATPAAARLPVPPPGQPPVPLAATPPPLSPPASPPQAGAITPAPLTELARHLERSTVLVLTEGGSGSGFFIAPDLIATNRHVIEHQADRRVLVTSKRLGQVVWGQVVAQTRGSGDAGAPDFAVIRIPAVANAEPLAFAAGVGKLQKVVVAGYPGLVIGQDAGFRRLLSGDRSAAPDLSLTEGSVSAAQTSAFGLTQIVHSAIVLTGNSGGPLVDACGRLVGVNTFIAVDQAQSGHVNYALSAGDLATFLAGASIRVTPDARICN